MSLECDIYVNGELEGTYEGIDAVDCALKYLKSIRQKSDLERIERVDDAIHISPYSYDLIEAGDGEDRYRVTIEPFDVTGGREPVILESPETNKAYARRCMRDALKRGEAPLASHMLYAATGTLDDSDPDQREAGIEAGFAWAKTADKRVVYTDRGISEGMRRGIKQSERNNQTVEYRSIDE